MSVDPLKSRALPSADPARVAGGEQAGRQEGSVEDRTSDAPGVVDEAGAVPQGTLSPARMHRVLRRLADGFYDGAHVRMEVARRVASDIGNSRPK